jgi:hypothetical protein
VNEPAEGAWVAAMRAADWARAWAIADRDLKHLLESGPSKHEGPRHLQRIWRGEDLRDKSVLVRCYHGLGDTLQFCRYLPALRRRVDRLTLEAPPALIPLLSRLEGPDRIVPFRPERPHRERECDLEIMELAHALRTVPDPTPYLPITTETGAGDRLRVGVCWQVNTEWQPERSVPPSLLGRLAAAPGVEFRSLQRGATAALPGAANEECPAAILDTARLIAGLDLVVTVDTMVAHLAGGIGVPVWLLLVAEPDWRWLAGGRGSPWYRDVRKYQQTRPGDWEAPLASLTADLTRLGAAGTLGARLGL